MNNTNNTQTQYDVEVTKKEGAEVEIAGEIPWEKLQDQKQAALQALSENADIPGFRKGKVPEDVLKQHVGEMKILHEMAQRALSSAYPEILAQENVQPIGQPRIQITKIGAGNPLGFKAVTAVMPAIELPDYKQIAADVTQDREEVDITEEDMEEAINHIRTQWAKGDKIKALQEAGQEDINPQEIEVTEDELPDITDEFAQKLGDFKTVDEFKEQLRKNLATEKENRQKEELRGKMLDAIVAKTKADIPHMLVKGELDRMVAQFRSDVERAGLEFDDYLEQADKELEELREEWKPDARKRAITQLVLNKIATKEDVVADQNEVEKQTQMIMEQYEDADEQSARVYVQSVLTNQKVLEYLENISE